jgi:hypothetical protein
MAEPIDRQLVSLNLGGVQPVAKDLSLISLVPKWAGTNKSCPLHEILDSLDDAACLGNWTDGDKVKVASLNLTDTVRRFINAATSHAGSKPTSHAVVRSTVKLRRTPIDIT